MLSGYSTNTFIMNYARSNFNFGTDKSNIIKCSVFFIYSLRVSSRKFFCAIKYIPEIETKNPPDIKTEGFLFYLYSSHTVLNFIRTDVLR